MPEPYRSEHDSYLERYRQTGVTWILNRTREFEVFRKDGRPIVCELSVSRIDVPGEPEPLFCGSFRDVTERVQAQRQLGESERRFRAIFDQEYQFVGLLEPDGTVVECNRAALRVAGKAREEVLGRPFWDACWPAESGLRDRIRRAVRTAARGGFVRFEADLGSAGERRWVDFSVKPVRNLDGEIVYLLPEGRDITELKRAQERENSMLRAFASVGESAAVLAHEIKNPITAVNAALRAVADELGADHRVVLEELAGKLHKLENLMRRTLSFVRPLELKLEPREIEPWLEEIVQSMRPVLDARGVRVELEVTAGCPIVRFDAQLLEEVVTNLLHNASEATGRGGRIRVLALPVEAGVEIAVEDDGPGVPAELRERLFQPFVSSKQDGTGIGLAISRKIVEEHGGTLELDASGALGGASFRARLNAGG